MSFGSRAGSPTNARPRSQRSADSVDAHVGKRVRALRILHGMSQEKLGDALGLTFQQVQKYERGANRIGAGRLFHLSRIFGVSVNHFFKDMQEYPKNITPGFSETMGSASPESLHIDSAKKGVMERRETLELVRAYYAINNPKIRKTIFEMIKAVSKNPLSG